MTQELVRGIEHSSRPHVVRLEQVPACFSIPAELEARFHHDPDQKLLIFRGFMSKATFDRLRKISTDFAYQRALEHLFQLAVPEEEPPPRRGRRALVVGGTLTAVLAALSGILFWLR